MSHPVLDGFDVYIATELGLSEETMVAYTRDVEEFLSFIGKEQLTSKSIEKFINHLKSKNLQQTTIKRKCMSIRCLCHHLISLDRVDENILDKIDSVRIHKGIPNALDDEDISRLLDVVVHRSPKSRATNVRRDVAIILIMYHSGLRASELCSLNLSDVNLSSRMIKVNGKGGRQRMVPTTIRCAEAIQSYLDEERQSDGNILFVKSNGQEITRRSISGMLSSLATRANVKHTTSHTLRRSCATSLMNRGIDLELVQSLLGHQSISATQAYLAVSQGKLAHVHRCFHPFGDKNAISQ